MSSNSVTVVFIPNGETPEAVSVSVERDDAEGEWRVKQAAAMTKWQNETKTNPNARPELLPERPYQDIDRQPHWQPFHTNLLVELGPRAGKYGLMFAFKYKGKEFERKWSGAGVEVQTMVPAVVFSSPQTKITSQPKIQLSGYVTTDVAGTLHYQIFNQQGVLTASDGASVRDKYFDQALFRYTTNYFTCVDLELSPGTNTIAVSGTDQAGFSVSNNFVCVFTTVGDTSPPVFLIDSPELAGEIADDSTTIRGPSDDATAKFVGQISANGHTNNLSGSVERNGYFWFENVPLAVGANQVTIVATDVAGNSSSTNFVIYGSAEARISMDPVEAATNLWEPKIKLVTGKVRPANNDVWINGVQATVKPDGTWLAKNVPVLSSPSGSTALFNLTTLSPGDLAKGKVKVKEQLSTQASLGTNAMVLNAAAPACGVFQLHLTDTAGHGFILEASTNLVEWTSILTNATPEPTFDYTDTNANNYHCRFFRVKPLQ